MILAHGVSERLKKGRKSSERQNLFRERKNLMDLQFPMFYPCVLVVKVRRRQSRNSGSKESEVMRIGNIECVSECRKRPVVAFGLTKSAQ
jgi:hypothetical protein